MENHTSRNPLKHIRFWHILAIIIVGSAIYFTYQVVVVQPRNAEAEKLIHQAVEKDNLNSCLSDANDAQNEDWSNACENEYEKNLAGYNSCIEYDTDSFCSSLWDNVDNGENPNCLLPTSVATPLNDSLQHAQDQCYAEYPQD